MGKAVPKKKKKGEEGNDKKEAIAKLMAAKKGKKAD